MDSSPQFCLRWNNYQSTLHHIFHRLFSNGTFVDVSLVVEGRKIDCHKVILSACSTYFEQLLSEHSAHPHPLVLLHDIPYSAVEILVNFMYKGEINVSHDQLASLLKAAETLKVKGLADSSAIANFTRQRLLNPETGGMGQNKYSYSLPAALSASYVNGNSRCYSTSSSKGLHSTITTNVLEKRIESSSSHTNPPKKKKQRHEESTTASLPPSPPISLGEAQNGDHARASPPQVTSQLPEIKVEAEDETDTELQIDESAGLSPSEATDSDAPSNRNTPVPDAETQEYNERQETAQCLAALASQGAPNLLPPHQRHLLAQQSPLQHLSLAPKPIARIKEEKPSSGNGKNGERSYTLQDLEEGMESVLMGQLTPAKAIAKYKVPRRTFFRRLSAVRKSRGIPSSKENSSEHFLNSSSAKSPNNQSSDGKQLPLVISGIVANDSPFLQTLNKAPKLSQDELKKEKKPSAQALNLSSGNVFSLLNVAANPNYEYYLKYLKLHSQGKDILLLPDDKTDKKEPAVDGNRNLSSEIADQALALITQNGAMK